MELFLEISEQVFYLINLDYLGYDLNRSFSNQGITN
jgi:hypothetical protein